MIKIITLALACINITSIDGPVDTKSTIKKANE